VGLPRSQRWTRRNNLGGDCRYDPSRSLRYPECQQGKAGHLLKPLDWYCHVTNLGNHWYSELTFGSFAPPYCLGPVPPDYADYYVGGGLFPVGRTSLRLDSPYYSSVKRRILAVCLAPHGYLSGPAFSPQGSLSLALRSNDSSPTCIGYGDFLSFHLCASWRTGDPDPHFYAQWFGQNQAAIAP
jgi:hypothetical protein